MFLENSRYFGQNTMTVKLKDARTVAVLPPRMLPTPAGVSTVLNRTDRLDIIALRQYQDATRFWHVADGNTQIEARLLNEPPVANSNTPPVRTILVPQK